MIKLPIMKYGRDIYGFVYLLSCQTFCDPRLNRTPDSGPQAPLSMGFSRKEYYSGLPFPSPGDLPNLGTESTSPVLAGGFFTIEPPGKPLEGTYLK